jgi:hypothetical protein
MRGPITPRARMTHADAHSTGAMDDRSSWVCVIRYGPEAQNLIAVGNGSVSGVVDGSPVDSWDTQLILIRDAFAEN